jgi:hypothetical protein
MMDSRVLTVVLRKLDAKLDRLDRLVNDMYEQLVAVDVKLDALLCDSDEEGGSESGESGGPGGSESGSESIGPTSTASDESDDSDMSFIVADHNSSSGEDSEPVPAYESASSSS